MTSSGPHGPQSPSRCPCGPCRCVWHPWVHTDVPMAPVGVYGTYGSIQMFLWHPWVHTDSRDPCGSTETYPCPHSPIPLSFIHPHSFWNRDPSFGTRGPILGQPSILLPTPLGVPARGSKTRSGKRMFYIFLFIFKEKKIIITFKLQLSRVVRVVLMYRMDKLCSDVGISLSQRSAW